MLGKVSILLLLALKSMDNFGVVDEWKTKKKKTHTQNRRSYSEFRHLSSFRLLSRNMNYVFVLWHYIHREHKTIRLTGYFLWKSKLHNVLLHLNWSALILLFSVFFCLKGKENGAIGFTIAYFSMIWWLLLCRVACLCLRRWIWAWRCCN